MSVIEYNNLKYNVSKGIDWKEEGEHLLYICKTFLPDRSEGSIQNVLSLLDKLEKEKRLAIDSLAVLKELLKQLDEWNLFEMVEKFENKRKKYNSFLEQCGRVLDECSQLKRLISLCEGKISHDSHGHIKNAFMLFRELEKQNNLGIELLEILKTMATELDKPDLLQQVEEFEKKRKQEEDTDRKRRKRQVQTAAVLASARYAGGRLIGIVTPQCTFRNVAGGIVVVTTWMILRRSSNIQEFVNTFTEAVLPLGNTLRAISEGSLCFTVQAETTLALEALWKSYQDVTLQRNLQEFLVTEEIKQLVGSEVSLNVKIDEQEYKDAVWDLEKSEAQEIEVKEDSAHARVREAHPEVREEISQSTMLSSSDRIALVEEYLANLEETYSMTTETTDSGLESQSAPSESGPYRDTVAIQEILERVDDWMKGISKKLDILTEPGGVSTRDEDILDNIQQMRKEMESIRKTLETLGKTEEKRKYAAKAKGWIAKALRGLRAKAKDPLTYDPSPSSAGGDFADPLTYGLSPSSVGGDFEGWIALRAKEMEAKEKDRFAKVKERREKASGFGSPAKATEPTTSLPSTEPIHDNEEPTTSRPSREPFDDDKDPLTSDPSPSSV